ncbi:hypothetical protein BEP19_08975 [Ammoniphilus oxalaticus]|uniref:Uncharacterized protein n=1 Tax=Ammoniphilus oxalaticus TaxID=66863 RepID=A0A419SKI2_9BACL|nr:hypothetical protein BEP19_08975 [Ammoniphilus oxalaticus]
MQVRLNLRLAAIVKGLRTTTADNDDDSSAVTGVETLTNGNRQRIRAGGDCKGTSDHYSGQHR